MKLTVLGSGSPEAHVRRASSGYLLDVGQDVILFDCGGGVFDNLLRAGRRPSEITHLVFSHLHSDHMMDYARLVHAAWDEGGTPIRVFGPPPIARITEGFFGADGVLAHDLRARTELLPSQEVWKARGGTLPRPWPSPVITEINPGFVLETDNWRLTSCEVPHAQPVLSCMAFAVEHAGLKFVYSGDAGLCPDLEALSEGADLLLHWCYRLDGETVHPAMEPLTPTPAQIARTAVRAGVARLVLTHFRIHMDAPGCHESALEMVKTHFTGPVSIAEDLDIYALSQGFDPGV
ncbi:MBL fold metallo-hydrolase [Ruegeria marina]|uniref:Ribonuclease BN, tRNA processing enzyme n=1 Tax=Ruegeria marina TaxID=639004 RepID=A0A1G6VV63_9RHOB|nr:MBL fold metallo-hydrolase [Ruegeria marina]SDD57479.1 Ribonuclease BN, tRNA processing enzyme [Ruegeria marina]